MPAASTGTSSSFVGPKTLWERLYARQQVQSVRLIKRMEYGLGLERTGERYLV